MVQGYWTLPPHSAPPPPPPRPPWSAPPPNPPPPFNTCCARPIKGQRFIINICFDDLISNLLSILDAINGSLMKINGSAGGTGSRGDQWKALRAREKAVCGGLGVVESISRLVKSGGRSPQTSNVHWERALFMSVAIRRGSQLITTCISGFYPGDRHPSIAQSHPTTPRWETGGDRGPEPTGRINKGDKEGSRWEPIHLCVNKSIAQGPPRLAPKLQFPWWKILIFCLIKRRMEINIVQ